MMLRSERSVEASELNRAAVEIQTSIDAQVSALYSVLAFVQSSESVSREEFAGFLDIAKVETLAPGMQGVGFAKAVLREAMDAAMSLGGAAATRKVTLVQEIDEDVQAGFLIYLPVTDRQTGEIDGFVYAPYRARDLFETALSASNLQGITVRAYVETVSEEMLLFSSMEAVRNPAMVTLEVANRDCSDS